MKSSYFYSALPPLLDLFNWPLHVMKMARPFAVWCGQIKPYNQAQGIWPPLAPTLNKAGLRLWGKGEEEWRVGEVIAC